MDFRKIMDTTGDALASTAAKYQAYVAKENAQEREKVMWEQANRLLAIAGENYPVILEVFSDALDNCAEEIQAIKPHFMDKVAAVPGVSLHWENPGVALYHFQFYYRRGSDMTAQIMTRIIQAELDRVTYFRNMPRLRAYTQFGANNRAYVTLLTAQDYEVLKRGRASY